MMVKEPPPAKVPPISSEPLTSAPVLKITVPRFPVIKPPPFNPFTLVNVEPERERPLLVPERVPPTLPKSTLLFAKAAIGSASARTASRNNFLENIFWTPVGPRPM